MIIKYDHLRSLGKKPFKEDPSIGKKASKKKEDNKKKEDRKVKTNPPEKFKSICEENNNEKENKGKENNFYKINIDDIYIKVRDSKIRGYSPRKFKEKKDEPSKNSKSNKIQKENSIINSKEEIKKSESNIPKVEQNEKEKIENDIIDFFRGECLNSIMFRILYEERYLDTLFNLFVRGEILEYSKEPFFNEILQFIILETNDQQKIDIIYNSLESELLVLSKNKYACYIINALIDKFYKNIFNIFNSYELQNISIEKIEIIFSKLKENIKELSLHQSGTFIIQNLIGKLYQINKKEEREIYEIVLNNFEELIIHQNGIFVMQKLIKINPSDCDELIKKIIEYKNFLDLIKDKNGNNRLIRDILDETKNKYFDLILSKINGLLCQLSIDKYASYIIQRLIEVADIKQTNLIYKEIKSDEKELSKHESGNYVINALNKKLKPIYINENYYY